MWPVGGGNTIYVLPQAEKERWQVATRPVLDAWFAAMRERNIDGPATGAGAGADRQAQRLIMWAAGIAAPFPRASHG